MAELTIFAKQRTKEDGKKFTSYLTKLTKKDGTEVQATVKFRETIAPPKDFPCNIIVKRENANLATRKYKREDTGEEAIGYTLWVTTWEKGSKYVDKSLDDFEF